LKTHSPCLEEARSRSLCSLLYTRSKACWIWSSSRLRSA
jgi:hypothetical protein